jgi:hypothetical protein
MNGDQLKDLLRKVVEKETKEQSRIEEIMRNQFTPLLDDLYRISITRQRTAQAVIDYMNGDSSALKRLAGEE